MLKILADLDVTSGLFGGMIYNKKKKKKRGPRHSCLFRAIIKADTDTSLRISTLFPANTLQNTYGPLSLSLQIGFKFSKQSTLSLSLTLSLSYSLSLSLSLSLSYRFFLLSYLLSNLYFSFPPLSFSLSLYIYISSFLTN